MKKIMQVRNKVTLLLISAILLLSIGFIFTACGVGPATKAQSFNSGNHALDFSDCPDTDACTVSFVTVSFDPTLFEGKPLTFEAWVKPKSTSTGTILSRLSGVRGAGLKYFGTSGNTTQVTPRFTIIRAVDSASAAGTSTATYTLDGTTKIAVNAWSHVAGMLVNNESSAATTAHVLEHTNAGVTCTGTPGNIADGGSVADDSAGIAQNDTWHMDLYVDGSLDACTYTYGRITACTTGNGTCGATEADPTTAADAYAHENKGHLSGPGRFSGIIDEARVWNVERTISTCMNTELGVGGICDRTSNDLITYLHFNEGSGHFVFDQAGFLSSGSKDYPDTSNSGYFLDWNTGWTTDTPF